MWFLRWFRRSEVNVGTFSAEAQALCAVGQHKQALEVYERIPRRQRTPAIMVEMGKACLALGKTLAALAYASEALDIDETCALAMCIQGEVLLHERRSHDAAARFKRALEIDPACHWAKDKLDELLPKPKDDEDEDDDDGASAGPPYEQLRHDLTQTNSLSRPVDIAAQQWIIGLHNEAVKIARGGDHQRALALAEQAVRHSRQYLGEECVETAATANLMGTLLMQHGNLRDARPYLEQALEIKRRLLGEEHPTTAVTLNNFGSLLRSMGDATGAKAYYERALAIRRQVYGEEHPETAEGVHNLSSLLQELGERGYLVAPSEHVLNECCKVLGREIRDHAPGQQELGRLLESVAKARTPTSDEFATRLCDATTNLCSALGLENSQIAECAHQRQLGPLLESFAEAGMPNWDEISTSLCDALNAVSPEAETILRELLQMRESMQGALAAVLGPAFALVNQRKLLGHDDPATACSMNSMGELLLKMGDFVGAKSYFEQALHSRRKLLGEEALDTAASRNNLGVVLKALGDLQGARECYEKALAIWCKKLGKGDPDISEGLCNMASVCGALNEPAKALSFKKQAADNDDHFIHQVFGIGTEGQRIACVEKIRSHLEGFLSLILLFQLSESPDAVRAVFDVVLRRKGLAAEAHAVQRDAILQGDYQSLRTLYDEWLSLGSQVAMTMWAGPAQGQQDSQQEQVAELKARRERIELELARQIPEIDLHRRLRTADSRTVASVLPPGTALVEFVHYHVFDYRATSPHRKWLPPRYAAFILHAGNPDRLAMIDLGEAASIDPLIHLFYEAVARPTPLDAAQVRQALKERGLPETEPGQLLRAAVFDPLRQALGSSTRLLLSPDSELCLLPFAMLPENDGRLLMDSFRISYVTAGRDVLCFGAVTKASPCDPIVVVDPDFDLAVAETQLLGATDSSRPKLRRAQLPFFERLPATRVEGEHIADLLGVQPWHGEAALKGRLKGLCHSPRILHLATHGFFFQSQAHEPVQGLSISEIRSGDGRHQIQIPDNPLLRSGLALAGVNTWLREGALPEQASDGLLTAQEASGLDLLATDLVVLSACKSGLGDMRTGEGVFGLQRGFTLAGAKTLVMSLWTATDEVTCQLMQEFYRRLLAGEGRADALLNAQQTMRRKYPNPFYWGGFICQGDPDPLKFLGQTM